MAKETEHKYLVTEDSYLKLAESHHEIRQGYLCREPERTVRVRTRDDKGYLTVKGKNHGDTRLEFEYEIPYQDALQLLKLCCGRIIHKIRYIVPQDNLKWEVDEFLDDLAPLRLAEIELPASDTQYAKAPFCGENVTDNPKYFNSNL